MPTGLPRFVIHVLMGPVLNVELVLRINRLIFVVTVMTLRDAPNPEITPHNQTGKFVVVVLKR
jgi:hypothetical protein